MPQFKNVQILLESSVNKYCHKKTLKFETNSVLDLVHCWLEKIKD